jgi:hypothetical protein
MSSNVLFRKVNTTDQVSSCNESDIVFCESTGEVYTHSKRYGVPTITEIGDDNPNADIQMKSSTLAPTPQSMQSSLNESIMALSLDEPRSTDPIKFASVGDIRYNNGIYTLDEFLKLEADRTNEIGVYIDEDTIVEVNNVGVFEWGLVGVDVNSSKYKSLSDAILDTNGLGNSNLLKSTNSELFKYVSNGWYVPSLGELDLIHSALDIIQPVLRMIGTEILSSYYWSSTSGTNSSSAWAYNMEAGEGQLGYRTSKLAVRRIKKV